MEFDAFPHEIQAIEETIVKMAALVEDVIARAIQALTHGDDRLADEVIATDREVDDLREQVRGRVIQIIERWAPIGPALRKAVASLLIADELERLGDHAVHVARGAGVGFRAMPPELKGDITELARLVRQQVREGVRALGLADEAAARSVCTADARVDDQYHQLFGAIQERMREHSEFIEDGTQLLFAMHDLERIADRIANICEDVIYILTGKYEKLN
jgi:phosphate transport system protein